MVSVESLIWSSQFAVQTRCIRVIQRYLRSSRGACRNYAQDLATATSHGLAAHRRIASTLVTLLLAGIGALFWSAASALPLTFNFQNPYASFIDPSEATPLQNNGPNCAATALMNSFVYLDNTFPGVYGGTKLTRGDGVSLGEARDELCGILGNATNQNIWQGKLQWFNTFAPRTPTTFEGMAVDDISTWIGKQFLQQGAPTLAFLATQIMKGQDVEIGITGGSEHELTLTGISLDAAGNISIDYIDPNCVNGKQGQAQPGPSHVNVTQQANGLHFGWQNGNGLTCSGAAVDVVIDSAWAESVLSEPNTLLLLALGGMGFMLLLRRRQTN